MKKVLGLGNALTDILYQVSEEELQQLNLPKGSMNLISMEQAQEIQERFANVRMRMVAGGSACNTITTIASLGGKAAFIGKIGNMGVGDFYREDLIRLGVSPIMLKSEDKMSGCSIVLITPDGERTFATYLGAALDMKPEDINHEAFSGYDIFHLEGYLVQNHALIEKAVRLAKEMKCKVSLDLASYNVVQENRDFLRDLVHRYVDIVFANEEEARAFTGMGPEESLIELAKECEIAIVKVGKKGSLVRNNADNRQYQIGAVSTCCVDSTGAGDLYAGGFLYALGEGFDLRRCAEIATIAAGRVCEVIGTKLSEETLDEIRRICALYHGFMKYK